MYIPQHLQNSAYFPLKTEEPLNRNYSDQRYTLNGDFA